MVGDDMLQSARTQAWSILLGMLFIADVAFCFSNHLHSNGLRLCRIYKSSALGVLECNQITIKLHPLVRDAQGSISPHIPTCLASLWDPVSKHQMKGQQLIPQLVQHQQHAGRGP